METQTQRVRNDVRIRFYEALQAQLTVKAAAQLVELAQEGVRLAKALYDAQDGARIDVLQAEIELSKVQIVQQAAENSQVATWRRLAYSIGLPDLPFTMLTGSLEGDLPQYEFDALWTKLADEHPQLQAASAKINQASQQIQRERIQPIPNVDVQFGVQKDFASNYTIAQAQFGVALPIFNRNQGNIYSAFAEMQRAEAERERLELWYRDQLADVYRDFATARQRVERYQQEILPRALENLELTTAGYQQGEHAFLRVLVARETYFQSRLEYLRAWTALRVAEVRLTGFTLTGGLDAAAE
ncbi:MAG: TolC family protein [Planctomycetaceae bacterium]